MSSPRCARSATAAPTARSSATTPSSCPTSGRATCSTRSTSTRVELLSAALEAGELAVHQDAGKVGLGAGIIAHVVGEDLVDMAIHLHRSAPPADGVPPF